MTDVFNARSGAESRKEFENLSKKMDDEIASDPCGYSRALHELLTAVLSDPIVLSKEGVEDFLVDFYLASKDFPREKLQELEEIAADVFSQCRNKEARLHIADWLARASDEDRAFYLVRRIIDESRTETRDEAVFSLQTLLMRIGRKSRIWASAKQLLDSIS